MKRLFYAFNISRQSFISLGVSVADTPLTRLRGLLGKVRLRSDEAIWVVPSHGVHTVGLLFPIDLIYLDEQLRVVDLVESLGPLRIAPLRWQCASVLELPAKSIFGSGTEIGDRLLIVSPEEMDAYWASQRPEGQPEQRQAQQPDPPPALRRAV